MLCPTCSKDIPETTTICPFCKTAIIQSGISRNPIRKTFFHSILIELGLFSVLCTVLLIYLAFIKTRTPINSQIIFIAIFLFLVMNTVIFGIESLVRIIRKKSSLRNLPLTISAILLGSYILFFLYMAIFHQSTASTRAKVSRAKAEMRTIATALEAYFIDNKCYPSPG